MKILILCLFICSCSTVNKKDFMKGYIKGQYDSCVERAKNWKEKDICEYNYQKAKSKY